MYGAANFAGVYCNGQNTTLTMIGKFTIVVYRSICNAFSIFGQPARGYTPRMANDSPWQEEKRR
jgi:hypothetical protein